VGILTILDRLFAYMDVFLITSFNKIFSSLRNNLESQHGAENLMVRAAFTRVNGIYHI
jgi:hypothetical protein